MTVVASEAWEAAAISTAETRALLTQLAGALGQGWAIAEDRYHNQGRWELHGPDGIELRVQVGSVQLAVCGIHDNVGRHLPPTYGCKRPTIRFSAAKTPERMASEITRRLLPTVREDAAILATARSERDARLASRLATLEQARQLLEGNLTWAENCNTGEPPEFEHATTSNHRYGETPSVAIELCDEPSRHLDEVRISNLDHEQVLVIVEAAARVIAAGRCPDHDVT